MSSEDLKTALYKLEGGTVYNLVKKQLASGVSAREILKTCWAA